MKLIILILVVFNYNLFATNIDVSKQQRYIGKSVEYYEDKKSKESIETITKITQFKKLKKNVHTNIITSSTFWYKFNLANKSYFEQSRYLVFDLPWIDKINIYIKKQEENSFKKYSIGNSLNFESRTKKVKLLNQILHLKKGNYLVYLEVKTRDPYVLPTSLLDESGFLEKIYKEYIIDFSIYSVIITMLIFNFILYFIIRSKVYIYYVLFLASYLLMSFAYNNYTFGNILFNYPDIQNWIQSIGIYIFSIIGLLFVKSFLNLEDKFPKLNKLTKYIIALYIILLFSALVISYQLHVSLAIIFVGLFSLYSITIAVYCYLKGDKSVLIFILGTIAGLLGTFITALCVLSIIPYNWLLFKAVDFGILIDSILLSVALANRYKLLYNSLEEKDKKLLILNEQLEHKVKERTSELALQLDNKNVLMKEMSHRVKNNLQIITALFSLDKRKIKDENAQAIIEENIQRIKSMSILYEKFLDTKDMKHLLMKDYISDIINDFKITFQTQNINFDINIDPIYTNDKHLIPLGLVINELLTNSFKHAFNDKDDAQISIHIKKETSNIILFYKDNGKGTDVDNIIHGFGFKLLKSLCVHQLGGKIEVNNNKGLFYNISFPI